MVSYQEPEVLNYLTEEDRLNSFFDYEWSHPLMSPEVLARAGFFYNGYQDQVHCNQCPITVRHWEGNEDAWFVHVKANPFCHFLWKEKGAEFIRHYFNSPMPRSLEWLHSCSGNATIPGANSFVLPWPGNFQCHCKLRGYSTQAGCLNCKHNYPRSCLLPCGHMSSCKYCSPKLKYCMVCKCPISFRVNARTLNLGEV